MTYELTGGESRPTTAEECGVETGTTEAYDAVTRVFAAHDAKANHDQKCYLIQYLLETGARLKVETLTNGKDVVTVVHAVRPKARAKHACAGKEGGSK